MPNRIRFVLSTALAIAIATSLAGCCCCPPAGGGGAPGTTTSSTSTGCPVAPDSACTTDDVCNAGTYCTLDPAAAASDPCAFGTCYPTHVQGVECTRHGMCWSECCAEGVCQPDNRACGGPGQPYECLNCSDGGLGG
jgi:hypothetical protein